MPCPAGCRNGLLVTRNSCRSCNGRGSVTTVASPKILPGGRASDGTWYGPRFASSNEFFYHGSTGHFHRAFMVWINNPVSDSVWDLWNAYEAEKKAGSRLVLSNYFRGVIGECMQKVRANNNYRHSMRMKAMDSQTQGVLLQGKGRALVENQKRTNEAIQSRRGIR